MLTHEQARAFYDRFGSKQDWQAFYEDAAVARLVEHLSAGSAKSVIEFGCGTGRFAESLLAHHLHADCRYLGLDVSSTMVRLAQGRLRRFGDRAEVRVTKGDTKLDVDSNSFDRFVSNFVVDLLAEEDIRSLLQEAHRVLVPGGLLGMVSLTHGFTAFSRAATRIWTTLHRFRPSLVGGCRPISLQTFMGESWAIRHTERTVRFGVPAEVLVAEKL